MSVVGITGRKFHGKDTAAQYFIRQGYVQMRFADPLKSMLRALYRTAGLSEAGIERRIEGDLKETPCPWLAGKTPRYAMQTLGAEWGRAMLGENVWVDFLRARVAHETEPVVVSDVRYPNEATAIAEAGGRVIKVEADKRVPRNEHSDHSSETSIDELPVDFVALNNGSIEELEQALAAIESLAVNDVGA